MFGSSSFFFENTGIILNRSLVVCDLETMLIAHGWPKLYELCGGRSVDRYIGQLSLKRSTARPPTNGNRGAGAHRAAVAVQILQGLELQVRNLGNENF